MAVPERIKAYHIAIPSEDADNLPLHIIGVHCTQHAVL